MNVFIFHSIPDRYDLDTQVKPRRPVNSKLRCRGQRSEDHAAGIGGCSDQRELQRDTDTNGCVVSIGRSSNKLK